ncbi:hypothetical protein PHET_04769 [Paragonimus heterotremus]|uniref:Dystrobrevin alpha n=1 Tax=Paragonimus heterotremus TaxID=100268 RepID=A0A8J4X0C6_9TREM|nr:hypothetical protein PHET_04769 [Paragonimus heterotremus]
MAAVGVSRAGTSQEQERLLGALSPTTQSHLGRTEGFSTGLSNTHSTHENPKLVSELHVLRQRKDELETRMNNLQRNRTELMLQLETLVRLLSVGGTSTGGGVSIPPQTKQPPLGLQPSDPNTEITSVTNLRSGTPSGGTRFGHNSRVSTNLPENPPRRSSSLSHASGDRLYNTGRVDSVMYKKPYGSESKSSYLTEQLHSARYSDSGSEVYLCSDPEVGPSTGFGSLARRVQKRQGQLSATTRSNDFSGCGYADNYEYPNVIQAGSTTDEAIRTKKTPVDSVNQY